MLVGNKLNEVKVIPPLHNEHFASWYDSVVREGADGDGAAEEDSTASVVGSVSDGSSFCASTTITAPLHLGWHALCAFSCSYCFAI